MGRLFWRIILLIIPILVIIGVFRVVIHGGNPTQFVPTWQEFLNIMAKAPTIENYLGDVLEEFNSAQSLYDVASTNITDLITFFVAVGSFFRLVGASIAMFFVGASYPFAFVTWLFVSVLGFGGGTINTLTATAL